MCDSNKINGIPLYRLIELAIYGCRHEMGMFEKLMKKGPDLEHNPDADPETNRAFWQELIDKTQRELDLIAELRIYESETNRFPYFNMLNGRMVMTFADRVPDPDR